MAYSKELLAKTVFRRRFMAVDLITLPVDSLTTLLHDTVKSVVKLTLELKDISGVGFVEDRDIIRDEHHIIAQAVVTDLVAKAKEDSDKARTAAATASKDFACAAQKCGRLDTLRAGLNFAFPKETK